MRKSKSLGAYKKRLWILFSRYIRKKDANEYGLVPCFSCGAIRHWKEMDAGHYYARSVSAALYFDERNVNCQCKKCNMYMHGNLTGYALALEKKYGQGILEELVGLKNQVVQLRTAGYIELIQKYKKLNEDIGLDNDSDDSDEE